MTFQREIIHDFIIHPRFRILRHVLLVVTLFLLVMGVTDALPHKVGPRVKMLLGIGYLILILGAVYTNIYWGVRRYLLQNRLFSYLLFVITIVCVVLFSILAMQLAFYVTADILEVISLTSLILNFIGSMVSVSFIITGVSTLILLKYWIFSNQKRYELESATLQTELENLKNQINPHFLFNMLNNAIMLIRKDGEQASQVLFKLEDLLRYQMEDSSQEEVALSSDIRFLGDFLNLEKVRRDKFEFQIAKEGVIHKTMLPPLLFIPFVENAVKHSQDSENASYVYISFKVSEKELEFICENSKPQQERRKGATGGLGLKNIVRRLELLYPDRHTLHIAEEKNTYTVKLNLIL